MKKKVNFSSDFQLNFFKKKNPPRIAITFPLGEQPAKTVNLGIKPLKSGGYIIQDQMRVSADRFVGVKDKPKSLVRFRFNNFMGAKKDILVNEDWVKIGDNIYKRVSNPR